MPVTRKRIHESNGKPHKGLPTGHVCDPMTCGLFFDPACPVWGGNGAFPWSPITCAEFVSTLRSPEYGPQLRAALLELLAEDIGRIVAEVVRRREGGK